MSSFNNTVGDNNIDHLFLQTLISRLQLYQLSPLLLRSLDDLLLDAFSSLYSSSNDDNNNPTDDDVDHKMLLKPNSERRLTDLKSVPNIADEGFPKVEVADSAPNAVVEDGVSKVGVDVPTGSGIAWCRIACKIPLAGAGNTDGADVNVMCDWID